MVRETVRYLLERVDYVAEPILREGKEGVSQAVVDRIPEAADFVRPRLPTDLLRARLRLRLRLRLTEIFQDGQALLLDLPEREAVEPCKDLRDARVAECYRPPFQFLDHLAA